MTIFELFPWFLAICVAVLSGTLSARAGLSSAWVWIIALTSGIISWLLYVFGLEKLLSSLKQRKVKKEKSEIEKRNYQVFDSTKDYPTGKNLFYECVVCGNAVSSMPKQNVSCKCRNILVDAGRIAIRDHAKVKLFSI